MTREQIGAEPILDAAGKQVVDATGKPRYKERDHWFTLQFKLLWKADAAQAGSSGSSGAAKSTAAGQTATPAAGRNK